MLTADLIKKYNVLNVTKYFSSWLLNLIDNNSDKVELWGSTGMLWEGIKNLDTSDFRHYFCSRVDWKLSI